MSPTVPIPDPSRIALQILEGSEDAVVAVDRTWRVAFVNAAAERFAGRPRAELLGEELWALFPESRGTELEAACRRAMDERVPVRVEAFSLPRSQWLAAHAYPVEGGLTILLRRPVEESRALGARLGGANEALQRANDELVTLSVAADTARERALRAVKERDEVIAMVSHDLKNPLHTINLTLGVLRHLPLPEEERGEKLEMIERAVDRMQRLITGLLDMRRIEAGQALSIAPEPIAADVLIRRGCELFRPQVEEKRIRLVCTAPEGCPAVMADSERMLQVFWNLLGNGVKFTPEGGRIRVGCEARDDRVLFSVRDSGPGIPPEHLDRLFDPFWQEKRTARLGTGLGLPIAKGIVEAHGGTIEVESRPGEGTTFFFTLPAAHGWSEGDPDRRSGEERRSGEDRRRG